MLRDELDITNDMEDPQLSSDPLKIAMMTYAKELNMVSNIEQLGIYQIVLAICEKVDYTQEDRRLTSFMMKDEHLFKDNDTSHLEARRIAIYLKEIESKVFWHGLWHTVFFIFTSGCFSLGGIVGGMKLPPVHSKKRVQEVISLSTLLITLALINIVSIVWITATKCCIKDMVGLRRKQNLLYRFCWFPLFLHSLSIANLVVNVLEAESGDTAPPLFVATIVLLLVYVMVFLAFVSFGNLKKHRWEWIFIELPIYEMCVNFFRRETDTSSTDTVSTDRPTVVLQLIYSDQYKVIEKEMRDELGSIYEVVNGRHSLIDFIIQDTNSSKATDVTDTQSNSFEGLMSRFTDSLKGQIRMNDSLLECVELRQTEVTTKTTAITREHCFVIILHATEFDLNSICYPNVNDLYETRSFCEIIIKNCQSWNSDLTDNQSRLLPEKIMRLLETSIRTYFPNTALVVGKSDFTLLLESKTTGVLHKIKLQFALDVDVQAVKECLLERRSSLNKPDSLGTEQFRVIVLCVGNNWRLSACLSEKVYIANMQYTKKLIYENLKVDNTTLLYFQHQ